MIPNRSLSSGVDPRRPSLVGASREDLAALAGDLGEPAYRAGQIFEWVYARRVRSFDEMTNLSRSLRVRLAERRSLERPPLERLETSSDGTKKYLHDLGGASAESVLMPEPRRTTFCLSSQAGCALDCRFCLTATMGFVRHLTPGEIVAQAMTMLDEPGAAGGVVNVVFMGMGEPLHNYDGVMGAFALLTDPAGMRIPRRKVTLSTAGLVPGIRRLAAERSRPRLAISLNATTDEVRSEIMPINRKYPLAELLRAAAEFPLAPRERVTFEYVMLDGVNASMADARRLAGQIGRHRLRAKVNLIPFNPGGGLEFRAPSREEIRAFADHLTAAGIPCSIRRNRGRDISAACGQLAVKSQEASA